MSDRFMQASHLTFFAGAALAALITVGCIEPSTKGTVGAACKISAECRGGMMCKACGCYPLDVECPAVDAASDGTADGPKPSDGAADGADAIGADASDSDASPDASDAPSDAASDASSDIGDGASDVVEGG